MKFVGSYSHHKGVEIWKDWDLYEWLTDVLEAPKIKIGQKCTTQIRKHIKYELENEGWAFNVVVDPGADLTIFAKKHELAIQVQTGNISRYAYDLLKLQHLYSRKEIEAAALIVPSHDAAVLMGSNMANAERIWNELIIFDRIVTVPLMLVSFE